VLAILVPISALNPIERGDAWRRERGYTLLEIMVVVFIIGLLVTIVAPRIVGRTDDAQQTKAAADLASSPRP
jgi:prepilin-type N-terminal cleavage/methylation domain-containing protein